MTLDKRYRAEMTTLAVNFNWPGPNRYETLLKQRHLQLLGRTIDLERLIAQRLNSYMLKSLEVAIARFEATDLTGIMDLDVLFRVNRLTHKLLNKYIKLDSFDALLAEANQSVSAPYGRITLHIYSEMISDFLPRYCFNSSTQRFIRMPDEMSNLLLIDQKISRERMPLTANMPYLAYGSKALNYAFSSIQKLYTGFIGAPHFRVICRVLGYSGIALIIEELLNFIQNKIQMTITASVHNIRQAMGGKDAKMLNPLANSAQTFSTLRKNLENLIHNSEIKTRVFQDFREIGNCLLFCLYIEQSLVCLFKFNTITIICSKF